MAETVVIPLSKIRRPRHTPKGRPVDPVARAEVAALIDAVPTGHEFLIENLHRVQDRFGHLSAAHLNALAEAMKLSMAEVYEVATFYHHFAVVMGLPCRWGAKSPGGRGSGEGAGGGTQPRGGRGRARAAGGGRAPGGGARERWRPPPPPRGGGR